MKVSVLVRSLKGNTLKKLVSLAAVLVIVLSLFQSAQAQSSAMALPAGLSPAPVRAVLAAGAYSISGFLYSDTNRNGIIDPGEPPLANMLVRLFKDNGDGVFNPATDTLVGSQYTGADGSYSFTGLDAGLYFVKVVQQGCVLVSGGGDPRPVTLPPSAVGVNFGYLCGNPDLGVTKDDGVTTVVSGSTTTYTIRVTNYGPVPAESAVLNDVAQAGLVPVSVTCSPVANNQCTSAPDLTTLMGSGIYLPFLDVNWFYEIRLTATVTATSGTVTNTVTVTPPAGFNDTNPNNNKASDTDNVVQHVDLGVTKDDGVTQVASGSNTTYTIRVTNNGPATVTGEVLSDVVGVGLEAVSVTCSSASLNQCVTAPNLTSLTSAGVALPTLTPGQFYEILLTAHVTATSGTVTNIANITPPPGVIDTNPANDSASDTDVVIPVVSPTVDLAVTKDDGVVTVKTGQNVVYAVRVVNNGPATVTGAVLTDTAQTGISLTGVACSAAVGNQCASAPTLSALTGTGAILPTLAVGQFYELSLSATITATSGSVTNVAHVEAPTGWTDTNPANNTASDTDQVVQFDVLYHLWFPVISNPSVHVFDLALGYEDLSLVTGQNDFDYNDWGLQISGSATYFPANSGNLQVLEFVFNPKTRGAAYDHSFLMGFSPNLFASNGTATVTTYDANHNVIGVQNFPFNATANNVYTIFPRTSEVFPGILVNTIEGKPYEPPQRFAKLTITFTTPFPFTVNQFTFDHPHGQDLFFNPILKVLSTGDEVDKGDIRLLDVPFNSLLWPEEGVRIDKAYPLVTFVAGNPPTITFPPNWWTVHNHCVYDGVPCGTP